MTSCLGLVDRKSGDDPVVILRGRTGIGITYPAAPVMTAFLPARRPRGADIVLFFSVKKRTVEVMECWC